MRRDIEDDLHFLAWESLKGHSLGAGFALQVGKALAKEGIYVETHLFNPSSVLLAMILRNIGEKAELVWKRL
ncbi:putative GDSL esterase/lipase [Sesbania bispinosa]|nr:putative GDSL esterase/lipase [Sesbania bispinosa]